MKTYITRLILVVTVAVAFGCASDEYGVDEPAEEEIVESDWEPMRTVEGEPLSDEEIDGLIARLPELEERDADEVEFKRRDESLPPPLTGDDIEGEWPPDVSRPTAQPAQEGPLRAQAFRPEGQVEPPFQVAIAFDRPVVDVGAVGTQAIPDELELSPEIDGRWRWLGTRTIVFEAADRWPMATEFAVELSEGLAAVDGSTLDERLGFEFSTPGPEVQTILPRTQRQRTYSRSHLSPQPVDAPVAVVFNQAIDQESAQAINIQNEGQDVPMTRLSGDDRAEVAEQLGIEEANDEQRVIALGPDRDYAAATEVQIRVQGPLASLEGPVTTMASESSAFTVRGPFELRSIDCPIRGECRPGQSVVLDFSNPIGSDSSEIEVTSEPEVGNLEVRVSGASLVISGDFRPRSDYRLNIPEDLGDVFGQQLQGRASGDVSFGSFTPFLAGADRSMVVRPTGLSPMLPVITAEIETFRLRVYDIELGAADYWDLDLDEMEPVDEQTISIAEADLHDPTEQYLDLSRAFEDSETGQVLAIIDQPQPWETRYRRSDPEWQLVMQRTDLAADISTDNREIAVDVTRISDGEPVDGADVAIGSNLLATTDADGEAVFEAPQQHDRQVPMVISRGDDELVILTGRQSFVPQGGRHRYLGSRSGSLQYQAPTTDLKWYVVDDRQMYKPGETVHIRGWIRSLENSPRSEPGGFEAGQTVDYTVAEPRRNEIADGEVELDRFGGFELEFDVPDEANLGTARINFATDANGATKSHIHRVQFQEFRRPEYEVTMETGAGPHTVDEQTVFSGQASYYAGGALGGADTTWNFNEDSSSYRPPNWQGWSFGQYRTWWFSFGRSNGDSDRQILPEEFGESVAGQTDADGRDSVEMHFQTPERGFARRVSATISVQDVDRQAWEASDTVLVHPSSVYVGLRSETNFISRDEVFELEAVAVDIDGETVEGRDIDVTLRRYRSSDDDPVDTCRVTSTSEPVSCSFSELSPGSYQLVASVDDAAGRKSESEHVFWVAGRDQSGAETAEEDELVLIPGADEFAVGDTAQLMVQAPYYPMEAIVELRRDGRYDRRRVTLTEDDPVVDVDIEETMIPNIHVQITALGIDDSYLPDHFASGSINLEVDRAPRILGVDIDTADDVVAPGDEIDVGMEVTDRYGEPVDGAQVFLFGVDESVLALSDYQLADPLSVFYPGRSSAVRDIRSRNWLLLDEGPDDWNERMEEQNLQEHAEIGNRSGIGGSGAARARSAPPQAEAAEDTAVLYHLAADDAAGASQSDAIELREVFDALAFYRSDLVTDAEGRVEVTEGLPDSLTRYRLMAVAIGEDDQTFGSGESDITARKPLMVSPSAPRFVNVGDSFDLPVVVHNQSDQDRSVDVALRATAGLAWLENPGRRIDVPAGERREIRFAAQARAAGDTRIQIAVSDDDYDDAELVRLPVMTPATTEAFATYGTIDADGDDAVLERIRVPDDAYPQYGGLEVSTSSTQLQALTDAFIHLTNYPFRSSPTLASRILSVLTLYDVLDAFEAAELPEPEQLEESLDGWVEELLELQRGDGGFGYWSSSRESSPFISVHAANALVMADAEGIDVADRSLRQALYYLSRIDRHLGDYGDRAAGTISAYALNVLERAEQNVSAAQIDAVISRYGIDELSMEALGWLLPMADRASIGEEQVLQRITNQVQETASTAEFQETYERGAHRILHTTRRTDGVVLDGLIQTQPDHPLVDKVVRGLLGHRQRGRWSNTQENVFILGALRRYFDVHEGVEPDFIARAWLGDDQIAEYGFSGRSTDRHHVDVPMNFLYRGSRNKPVVFQRDGVGRMYYRLGMNYAPRSRQLPSEDQGFAVERNYEAVDDDGDVRRTDEGWEITAGSRVRVELSMTVPARRYHVALVDWLPAGFEPLNTALSVTAVDPDLRGGSTDRRRWGWWSRPWYEHQNLRDERVEAFSSLVSQGVHTYSYVARATTPGQFVAMPAKAEEMYHPETFGRSASETVTVVDD